MVDLLFFRFVQLLKKHKGDVLKAHKEFVQSLQELKEEYLYWRV